MEECPLCLPQLALGGGDAGLALLEEGAVVHVGPSGELPPLEGVPDGVEGGEDDDRLGPDEDAEDLPMPGGQTLEAAPEVAHVQEGEVAENRQAEGTRREAVGSTRCEF